MARSSAINDRFERSFHMYEELVASLDAAALTSRLPDLRSNTIGAQLWCVVGARESYARAIDAGGWVGFSCSLSDPADPEQVSAALRRSREAVAGVLDAAAVDDARERLLVDLLEHEAEHHGQLIRYLYALEVPIPASWRARYALD